MKKQTIGNSTINNIKCFLLRAGKQVYDNDKSIYYIDYNGISRKLTRA